MMHWYLIIFMFINGTGDDKKYQKIEFPVPPTVCFNIPQIINKDPRYYATCDYRD